MIFLINNYMPKMKICFLTESLSPASGWGRYSLDLIRALSRKGVNCKVLTQRGVKNQLIDGVDVLDIARKRLPLGSNVMF